jgi:hypothetical protein
VKPSVRRARRRESPARRAFRDAVRDILAAEGWFELLVDPVVAAPADARRLTAWLPRHLATA